MAKKTADVPEQRELVPLTEEERKALPGKLATTIKKLEDLEEEHKEARSDQAAERKKLRGQISAMAGQLRSGGR
jgi:hypothetical protein